MSWSLSTATIDKLTYDEFREYVRQRFVVHGHEGFDLWLPYVVDLALNKPDFTVRHLYEWLRARAEWRINRGYESIASPRLNVVAHNSATRHKFDHMGTWSDSPQGHSFWAAMDVVGSEVKAHLHAHSSDLECLDWFNLSQHGEYELDVAMVNISEYEYQYE